MPSSYFLLLFLFASLHLAAQSTFHPEITPLLYDARKPFYFGVASGDPLPNAVVIWTKIIPEKTDYQRVEWEMATDSMFINMVQTGQADADSSTAYTIKVDVKNLSPGNTYFFRFHQNGHYSPTGRTRTAPTGDPEKVRFAVVSCADYQSGYYNAYGHIARRNDLDAVLHLGDYIYEYGPWRRGRKRMLKNQIRSHLPAKECTTLQDYRTRYAQYRLDPQLQEAHRLHPFIVIWDDHEIANNATANGAQNHEMAEGDWEKRKAVARQAYFEWLPIRDNLQRSIIRRFTYGRLADLWMLDERLEARSAQARSFDDPNINSPERHMLGEVQADWLTKGMEASTARWKVIGNQVVFSPLNDSKVFTRTPGIRMDRWDGYPAERQQLFDFFQQHKLRNIVIVTGDVHTSWAFDLTADPQKKGTYDAATGAGVIGAEFVTPSISSFNFDEVVPKVLAAEARRRFLKKKNNPHLRYLDLIRHGYMTLTLNSEKAEAEWWFVKRKDQLDSRCKKRAARHINFDGKKVEK